MRALIAGIVHESSTLMVPVAGPTTAADFERHDGDDLVAAFAGTNSVTGGYLAACERLGVAAVPALHARAEPGAAVEPAAFAELDRDLAAALEAAGPVDVALLDLHGAGTLVGGDSLDEAVVRRVRAAFGCGVRIAVTVDLHANLPDALLALVDVVVGFQEYPHVDMASRAGRAAAAVIGQARGERRPVPRGRALPMLLPPSTTDIGPAALLRDLAREAETEPGVLACTVLHGYPYADTPQACARVLVIGDDDPAPADRAAGRLAGWLWEHREDFLVRPVPPAEAVAEAMAAARGPGPAVIGDATDNPGVGATGDGTFLLRALLCAGTPACLATIHDPATVAAATAAGVGAELNVSLGGGHGAASGPPVCGTATVRALTDGRVVQRALRRGQPLDFGPCARLGIGAVDVVVASHRRQVFDPEILLLHGLVPERFPIVAVKSTHHFRAGFGAVAGRLLVADSPGPLGRDITRPVRLGPTAARWPNDPAARWAPAGDGAGRPHADDTAHRPEAQEAAHRP